MSILLSFSWVIYLSVSSTFIMLAMLYIVIAIIFFMLLVIVFAWLNVGIVILRVFILVIVSCPLLFVWLRTCTIADSIISDAISSLLFYWTIEPWLIVSGVGLLLLLIVSILFHVTTTSSWRVGHLVALIAIIWLLVATIVRSIVIWLRCVIALILLVSTVVILFNGAIVLRPISLCPVGGCWNLRICSSFLLPWIIDFRILLLSLLIILLIFRISVTLIRLFVVVRCTSSCTANVIAPSSVGSSIIWILLVVIVVHLTTISTC